MASQIHNPRAMHHSNNLFTPQYRKKKKITIQEREKQNKTKEETNAFYNLAP